MRIGKSGSYIKYPVTDDYDAIIVFSTTEGNLSGRVCTKAEKLIEQFSLAWSTKHPVRKVGFMNDWLQAWKAGVLVALSKDFKPNGLDIFFVFKP